MLEKCYGKPLFIGTIACTPSTSIVQQWQISLFIHWESTNLTAFSCEIHEVIKQCLERIGCWQLLADGVVGQVLGNPWLCLGTMREAHEGHAGIRGKNGEGLRMITPFQSISTHTWKHWSYRGSKLLTNVINGTNKNDSMKRGCLGQNLRMEWKIHVSSMSLSPGFGICLPLHELPSGWSYRRRWDWGLPFFTVIRGLFLEGHRFLRKPNICPPQKW